MASHRVRNLVATTAGQVGEGLLAFLFVPLFLRRLGDEAWGLAALVPLANGVLMVVGFPLTTAINRELSRLAALGASIEMRRRTLAAVQAAFLVLAAAVAAAIWFAAPWIAEQWLRPETLAIDSCVTAVRLVGVYVAVLLLRSAYLGALYGLDRQVQANMVALGAAIAVTAAGLWVVRDAEPANAARTIVRFLAVQCALHAAGTLIAAVLAWRAVAREAAGDRAPGPALGDASAWQRLLPFVRGMLLVAVATAVVTQVDKLVASRLLTLGDYGLYAAAATLGSGIGLLVRSVNMASFPDLSRAFARDDEPARAEQARAFHRWARAAALVVLPIAATLALLPREALAVWLGPDQVAPLMPPVLAALALGWAFNGLAAPAFNTAFAAGWTGFAVRQNMIALAVMPLAMVALVPWLGATGAALAWTVLNGLYVLFSVPWLFFRRLLTRERRRWIVADVAIPSLAAGVAVVAVRVVAGGVDTRLGAFVACALAGLASTGAVALALRGGRR